MLGCQTALRGLRTINSHSRSFLRIVRRPICILDSGISSTRSIPQLERYLELVLSIVSPAISTCTVGWEIAGDTPTGTGSNSRLQAMRGARRSCSGAQDAYRTRYEPTKEGHRCPAAVPPSSRKGGSLLAGPNERSARQTAYVPAFVGIQAASELHAPRARSRIQRCERRARRALRESEHGAI